MTAYYRSHIWGKTELGGLLVLGGMLFFASNTVHADEESEFNQIGNIVIADQFNNRVIEINPENHNVVWRFGNGSDKPGTHSIVGTNDAERVGELTLISGTGIPSTPMTTPPTPPLPGCSDPTNGCPDNRVILVNSEGEIVWQYGQNGGVAGFGPDQLNVPVAATMLPNFHILITDQSNERIIEVTLEKNIVWQYGTTGTTGSNFNQLNNPNSAELLDNGHILIADENNDRVIEVDRAYTIIQTFTARGTVSGAAFASRLQNGHTLITDSNHSRIVEVDANDNVVWEYFTNKRKGSITSPLPTRAVRLRNGNTLISDQFNDQVIEINPDKKIIFVQGKIGVGGNRFDELNGPYDAKVVGDYTGLTSPPRGGENEGNANR